MFTGIIEEVGTVEENQDGKLIISCKKIVEDANLGDSIAVNGVDLTVNKINNNLIHFDVMPETFRRSNLIHQTDGSSVNLESSLTLQTKISGHIVRGVVETTCFLESLSEEQNAIVASYKTDAEFLKYILIKGPVTLDGVSLTVISKNTESFSVSLVEWTQQNTNLLMRENGDEVNLETDIFARYIEQLIDRG
ncbi:MAG: riboflavin synthase [Dehalococcoidia bacterium]|tara:strand:- start:275 stop:853 length:579 start_codon:yes stop_codon:yes gene_type:complete